MMNKMKDKNINRLRAVVSDLAKVLNDEEYIKDIVIIDAYSTIQEVINDEESNPPVK